MIGQIAAVTKHIRVGSGGVMLPNHAPLVVAERFKMLEALFPGRIDLGLGRAPGTDGATAHALRSRLDARQGDDFLERLSELLLWETREFPEGHPYNNVVAMPDDAPLPPIFLLGSSDYSSELAAQVGMGFAFAHHFASFDAADALVQCFVDASIKGWYTYLYGDNKAANDMIKKDNPEMDDDQIAFSVAQMKEYGIVDSGDALKLGIGAMTDERMQSFYDKMVKAKVLPAGIDIKKAYTLQFVNKGVGLNLK
eukprot:gene56905-77987_t